MAGVGLPHERDRRAGAARDRPGRPPRAARPTARRRVAEIAEVARDAVRRRSLLLASLGAAAGGLRRAGRARGGAGQPGASARWVRRRSSRCARAGREGYSALDRRAPPARRCSARRRRSLGGWFVGGPAVALPLAVAGPGARRPGRSPAAAAATGARSSARCPRSRARSPTRSPPAARCGPRSPPRPRSLDGPPAVELARLGAELDLGAPTADALEAWRGRVRSERVDAFAAALLSQRLAGGDLAGLLRRFADGAAERDRVAEDARTGHRPGPLHRPARRRDAEPGRRSSPSCSSRASSPGCWPRRRPLALLALAACLQLAGFVAIRRLSRMAG